ncbi:molybdopterin synthase catalytic subunit [Filimonas lacunae]|uniref:Molybdopterin synthase catalytic subunit n=1 Tax=Filimonas lacunae TaxID=477680 RepID=A0A173MHZ6_9BACT|nr:molybdenum cofactor biosynthesis protein MoaE [Filimonas lacunae]BAV07038.1 molybdenum cofactor biosynthesis protein MoaE [Filimonas lacunae]SIS95904.1 molybdopterin synthase catalytic subunit [Filimonas lacunae]
MMSLTTTIFREGAITPDTIATCLQQYATDQSIGGYSCFIGQVRADIVNGNTVTAIEYTTYREMAETAVRDIATQIQQQYALTAVEVLHSLGTVAAGGICLLVLTAAPHRKAAMQACDLLVERIKAEVPIWGKEILNENDYQWKVNQ